jgi:hypothetical protein
MKQLLVSLASAAKPSAARWLALAVLCTLALFGAVTVSPGTASAAAQTTSLAKPATPTIDTITPTNATIRPTGSSNNDGYSALRLLNGVWVQWADTGIDVDIIYLNFLSPGTTYTVALVAFDNNGNQSPRSDPLTFTTPSRSAPTCRVQRSVFGTQYMAQIFAENLTTVAINNWSVTFTMPASQQLVYGFGINLARSGDQATLTAGPGAVTSVVPGMTLNTGFVGSNPASAPLPSNFAFNSAAFGTISCAVS